MLWDGIGFSVTPTWLYCQMTRDVLFLCVILWHQIKALIKKYIQRQQTINLVVVPCNVDIATTEALSMAQEVDPDGDRTIGERKEPSFQRMGGKWETPCILRRSWRISLSETPHILCGSRVPFRADALWARRIHELMY